MRETRQERKKLTVDYSLDGRAVWTQALAFTAPKARAYRFVNTAVQGRCRSQE